MHMNVKPSAIAVLASLLLDACAPYQVFSPQIMEGVDPDFDFARWRMVPNTMTDRKVRLGGRIVQAETRENGVVIVVAQLPIVEHPAYGPKDIGKRGGEFVVTYQGKVGQNALQPGNRLIVVGTTQNAKVVVLEDFQRSLPSIDGRCLHIWNTGGRDIEDFPSYGAGYEPLEEDTYCARAR